MNKYSNIENDAVDIYNIFNIYNVTFVIPTDKKTSIKSSISMTKKK